MWFEELTGIAEVSPDHVRSRLRLEGLVQPRRDGKTIYYSLTDDRSRAIIELVYELFCRDA